MGIKQINPLFRIQEKTREMIIGNPYRFASAGWTPPGAVLWYYGSELSGSQWADRIGTNHGTFQGGASAAADGVACSTTKYVTAASAGIELLVAGSNVLCSAFWIKATYAASYVTALAKNSYYSVNNWSLGTLSIFEKPDRIGFSMGKDRYGYKAINIGTGDWFHIAYVYDKVNSRNDIYVNGSKQTGITASETFIVIPSNSNDLIIGRNADYIDDVILSTTAWTDNDVSDIYNNSPATHK